MVRLVLQVFLVRLGWMEDQVWMGLRVKMDHKVNLVSKAHRVP